LSNVKRVTQPNDPFGVASLDPANTFVSKRFTLQINTTMNDRSMMTRSKVLRSPPTARKSSTAKSPTPVDESVPDIDSLFDAPEDINDAPNSVTNNDVLQILQEIRGITRKIDALNTAVESIRQELKEELITRIDRNETNIAAHDQRLDVIEEAIVELRDETEAASRATDLVVRGIPMQQNENAVDIYVKVASAIGYGNGGPNIPSADIFHFSSVLASLNYEEVVSVAGWCVYRSSYYVSRGCNCVDRHG
jgi:hypothetical protein